jgi:hypothetical protein
MVIKRKSQMEILGLAILFVIIIFGFLIFMMLGKGSDEDTVAEFKDPKMVQSVLDTMVKVSVECDGQTYSLSDLWKDCVDANLGYIKCSSITPISNSKYTTPSLSFPDSCAAAEYATVTLLNKTMDEYFKTRKYWFKVDLKSGTVTSTQYNNFYPTPINCQSQMAPAYQPITLSRGTMYLSLGVCLR